MRIKLTSPSLFKIKPFYDSSTDLLAYACGWLTVFCAISLMLTVLTKDTEAKDRMERKKDAWDIGLTVALIVLSAALAVFLVRDPPAPLPSPQPNRFPSHEALSPILIHVHVN